MFSKPLPGRPENCLPITIRDPAVIRQTTIGFFERLDSRDANRPVIDFHLGWQTHQRVFVQHDLADPGSSQFCQFLIDRPRPNGQDLFFDPGDRMQVLVIGRRILKAGADGHSLIESFVPQQRLIASERGFGRRVARPGFGPIIPGS